MLGWYRFLQYADITSERPVACLVGTWDGNAPVEERLRSLTAQSSWLCSHTNGYASAMNFVDFISACAYTLTKYFHIVSTLLSATHPHPNELCAL